MFFGFGGLLILTWLPLGTYMLDRFAHWSSFHYVHFIGLVALLCMFLWGMAALSHRLSSLSDTSLHPAQGSDPSGKMQSS